uniref:Uncharacterized protein n=1 Tax=Clastoptera arizonana TaxID=38151 RepID=A0A1B6DR27_9HEMI
MESRPSNVYLSLFSENSYYNEVGSQNIPSYDEIINSPFYKGVDYRNQVMRRPNEEVPEIQKNAVRDNFQPASKYRKIKCNVNGKVKYVIIGLLLVLFVIVTFLLKIYLLKSTNKVEFSVSDLVPTKEPWFLGKKYTKDWEIAMMKTCKEQTVYITQVVICCNKVLDTDKCNNLTSCIPYLNDLSKEPKYGQYIFLYDNELNIYEGTDWPCSFLDGRILIFGNIGCDICNNEYSIDDDFFKNIKKMINFMDKRNILKNDLKVKVENCDIKTIFV